MKTIFIATFEGVEAKNILRTGIVNKILAEGDIRVVLFMKNMERAERYREFLNNDRISYEIVKRPKYGNIDNFFARLKFNLINTQTTDLRRRLILENGGSHFSYYISMFVNHLIARPFVRKIVRRLDFLLVRDNTYKSYFNKYNPDLVFMSHLFDEPEIHMLREAKRRGVKTIGFINSWDKLTARCMMRLLPEKVIVFNDIVKKELLTHGDMGERDIYVGGIPQYDVYFTENKISKEEFCRNLNLDPAKKLVLFAPESISFNDSAWEMIDRLYELNSKGYFGEEVEILIRFQPNYFVDMTEIKKRRHIKFEYPGIRFSEKRGVDWDFDLADILRLKSTLYHMSLLVSYASSIVVDAAIFNKPIINIDFEIKKSPPHKSPTRFYKMEHYANVVGTNGVYMAKNSEDLSGQIKRYLAKPDMDEENRKRLVDQQCKFTDGKSAERIANFILQNV